MTGEGTDAAFGSEAAAIEPVGKTERATSRTAAGEGKGAAFGSETAAVVDGIQVEKVVRLAGLEPATPGLGILCSIHLS